MFADWLDGFLAVREALLVNLDITAHVLESVEGGTFETHHNHLDRGYILAMVAHNMNILDLRWCLGANCVPGWIESADKTTKRQEMAAVNADRNTHLADDID